MDTADGAAIRFWSQEDTGPITILREQREQVPFGKMHQALGFALQVDLGRRTQLEEVLRGESSVRAQALHVLSGDGYDVMATATSALVAAKWHGHSV